MPIEIRMPALSPTMTEGNLARWLKNEGDRVAPGDVIAEIETDKATMEVEAVDEGTLGKIVIGDGTEGVPVNTVIGVLLEEGEEQARSTSLRRRRRPTPAPSSRPSPRLPAAGSGGATEARKTPGRASGPTRGDEGARSQGRQRRRAWRPHLRQPAGQAHGQAGRASISPCSRAAGRTAGSSRPTSSARSRRARPRRPARRRNRRQPQAPARAEAPRPAEAPGIAPAMPPAPPPAEPYEEIKLSNMRKVIARRLTEAKQTIPHYYLTRRLRAGCAAQAARRSSTRARAPTTSSRSTTS